MTGYDDSRSVLRLSPGTKFRVLSGQTVYRRLGENAESLPKGREAPHICHPWTTVPCVLLSDEDEIDRFHLVYLPVRTDVEVLS